MKNDINKALIAKIAQIRTKNGISLEFVAEKLGLTTSSYWKIENGKTKLSVDRLSQLSEILDVPYNELLEAGNDDFQHSNNGSARNNQQTI